MGPSLRWEGLRFEGLGFRGLCFFCVSSFIRFADFGFKALISEFRV